MSKTSSILKLLSKMSRFTHFSWVKSRLTTKASLFVLSFVKQGLQKLSTLSKYATTWFYQYLLAFVKVRLQIFHRNKKIKFYSHLWIMIKHYHFIWQRCCEVFRVIQPQIQFHPCSGRSFLPGPDYFAWESSYIWSRVSMERGNCYISPPYCSKLLHFTLILVLREKILWRQDYRDWRTNHVCAGGGDDDGGFSNGHEN